MKSRFIFFIICLFHLSGNICFASDEKRESDFAEAINRVLMQGKAVWLEAEGKKFFGIYNQGEKVTSKGAVIILHDMGGHPDQQPVIHDLRTFLSEHDWSTLALQMPLREVGVDMEDYYVLFPEAVSRIQAGISYAKSNGAESIIIVGYGLGGLMGIYAQSEQMLDIKALVVISLPVPKTENKAAQTLQFMRRIKIPMLDIYGALDLPEVTLSAKDRRQAAKENEAYRQVKIDDEGHEYLHDEGLLVKRIYSWLGAK